MQGTTGVIEGDLARQVEAGREIDVPDRFQRSAEVAAPLGPVAPVASLAVGAASLGACHLLGIFDLGTVSGWQWAVAVVVMGGRVLYAPISERDDRYDRMRWAHEAPAEAEVMQRYTTTRRIRRAAWLTAKYTTLLVLASLGLYAIDPDWNQPWPVLFSALVAGNGISQLVNRKQIERYEREHGIELLQEPDEPLLAGGEWFPDDDDDDQDLDLEAADDDEEDEDDDDLEDFPPPPMFYRPAPGA